MPIKAIVFDAYGTLYDVQSVAGVTDAAFPGHGDYITQLWRLKQLEYTWLRSMMGRYADFWTVTREALTYTLATLGLPADAALLERIAQAYNRLTPYADARRTLDELAGSAAGHRLAILSNGSPAMLTALVAHSGLHDRIGTIVSVDEARAYKPDPAAYRLVEKHLGVAPAEVLFVSSNGFDVGGAKAFGFRVARIERVTPAALQAALTTGATIGPATMFKAQRSQTEHIGEPPDIVLHALSELPAAIARGFAA